MLNDLSTLDSQKWLYIGVIYILSYIFSTLFVSFFGRENKLFLPFLKQSFFSLQSVWVALGFLLNFLLCFFLYGYDNYTWFLFGVLGIFFTLALIDCYKLAVPDLLNFSLVFFVFLGLYYFDVLEMKHFITSFALLGAFSFLRMFGGFIFGKEVMGEADLIVIGSVGAFFPLFYGFYVVVVSAIFAMVYILLLGALSFKDKKISLNQIKIPFVFFLFLGFVLGILYERFPIFGVLNV